jgi:hypothetical protein
MYRSLSSLRAPATRRTPMVKLVCVLLIVFTVAAILHVHKDNGLDASRPCPVCVAIQCAIVMAVLVAAVAQAAKARPFCFVDCEGVSPLLASELFVRPPPAL